MLLSHIISSNQSYCLMSPVSSPSVQIDHYDYFLPESRIARYPLETRSESKLLLCVQGNISHTYFKNLAEYTAKDELMIFNNSRVIQARIIMHKQTGSRIEIFLLEPSCPAEYDLAFTATGFCTWKCMTGNKKRWKDGRLEKDIHIDNIKTRLSAETVEDHGDWQVIRFSWLPRELPFSSIIKHAGLTPIPPYLKRMPRTVDKTRYQTVYSRYEGSVAAPTAGLHFTKELLAELNKQGTHIEEITLHVGAGTFQPVKTPAIDEHPMHTEKFSVNLQTIEKILKFSGKITAVGTTSARTLESLYWLGVKLLVSQKGNGEHEILSQWEPYNLPSDIPVPRALENLCENLIKENKKEILAKTQLMIIPGYKFRLVNKMITNFHQPKSTLLLLTAAFIGNNWRKVYDYALDNDFRFLSYGDSSLLIP